jgi:GTP pyrophosphokinase
MLRIAREAKARGDPPQTASASIDQVLDHLALRVVFEHLESPVEKEKAEAMCYHVLNLVHNQWGHNKFRVKDYISNPKPNGYQSLHTTAHVRHHGREWPFEVQVRTREMHRVAEWGQAAHASYKACGSLEDLLDDEVDQAPRVQSTPLPVLSRMPTEPREVPKSVFSDREYALWLQRELREQRVFVFMNSEGSTSIWDLERGVSIKDAMWRHRNCKRVDDAIASLRINGGRVSSDYILRNGDAIKL